MKIGTTTDDRLRGRTSRRREREDEKYTRNTGAGRKHRMESKRINKEREKRNVYGMRGEKAG